MPVGARRCSANSGPITGAAPTSARLPVAAVAQCERPGAEPAQPGGGDREGQQRERPAARGVGEGGPGGGLLEVTSAIRPLKTTLSLLSLRTACFQHLEQGTPHT